MRIVWLSIVLLLVLAACSKDEPKLKLSDLPPGDAVRGAELFQNGAPGAAACSSCHQLTVDSTAPQLGGFGERAGKIVKGQSAEEYAYYSILRPSKHVVDSFSNIMPNDYEEKLSAQQLADLIAYLLTL